MSSRLPNRPPPPIPDHEVLRKIGFGSYGEVWLARGVTGAWRGVKVVYRDDFDDAHSFEREFKGILAYEPLSRRCEGLVQILHVGRNRARGFYYYVMELGDDETRGRDIQPVDYQPRTLRGDLLRRGAFPLPDARKIAQQLADAIAFLHEHGLVHRDIKPANVIFVDGNAKLADIGLVAAHGQRTYVGTEGFSPPEGPGSVQGDVYALGKVTYEMATGKDRLEFPAPPETFADQEERQQWLALDAIICRACNPDPRRRFRDGRAMERALDSLLRRGGEPAPWWQELPKRVWAGSGLAVAAAALGMLAWQPWRPGLGPERGADPAAGGAAALVGRSGTSETGGTTGTTLGGGTSGRSGPVTPPVAPTRASVNVWSLPTGARVLIDGKEIDTTPVLLEDLPVGSTLEVTLALEGYRDVPLSTVVQPVNRALGQQLERWSPPQRGKFWINSFGMEFDPLGNQHTAKLPVLASVWARWPESQGSESRSANFVVINGSGQSIELVSTPREEVERFILWLAEEDRRLGYLDAHQYYEAQALTPGDLQRQGLLTPDNRWPTEPAWRLRVREFQGEIEVITQPDHARVEVNGAFVGYSPMTISDLQPGNYDLNIRADGFEALSRRVVIDRRGQKMSINETLVLSDGLRFGQAWGNSLGIRMLPISENLMAAATETTVGAFRRYTDAIGTTRSRVQPLFRQGDNHPVVLVSREEAMAFCAWLTQRERSSGRIGNNHHYRLPTDAEWSLLAELEEPPGRPAELDGRAEGFAWGLQWPPPRGAANLGVDLDDGFTQTAPVGKFRVRNRGLRDLAGNVWEWVSDPYDPADPSLGIARGSSFRTTREGEAKLSTRSVLPVAASDDATGFRVVLERTSGEQLPGTTAAGAVHLHPQEPGAALSPGENPGENPGGAAGSADGVARGAAAPAAPGDAAPILPVTIPGPLGTPLPLTVTQPVPNQATEE